MTSFKVVKRKVAFKFVYIYIIKYCVIGITQYRFMNTYQYSKVKCYQTWQKLKSCSLPGKQLFIRNGW